MRLDLRYQSFAACECEYQNFLEELSVWVLNDCDTPSKGLAYFANEILKRVDWGEVAIIAGVTIASAVLTAVFPSAAPAIMISSGAVLEGDTEVYRQLKKGEPINWYAVILRTGAGAAKGSVPCVPEIGAVTTGLSVGGFVTLENYLCSVVKGNHSPEALCTAVAQGGFEGLSVDSLKWLGNKIAQRKAITAQAWMAANKEVCGDKPNLQPLSEAELEKVVGGAKDPNWRPGGTPKAEPQVTPKVAGKLGLTEARTTVTEFCEKLTNRMRMSTSEALSTAERFLGKDYKDMGNG